MKLHNYCARCLRETNHVEIFRKKTGNEPGEDFFWNVDYLIIECAGCEKISFRKESCSEDSDRDPDTGDIEINIQTFPSVLKNRKAIEHVHLLPRHVELMYEESINALANDCKLLAGAGFRAIIEAVCNDKDIKAKNIQGKIDKLHSNGFLSKTETTRLHAIRFLGNDSIHEMEVPTEIKLQNALDIIEHLLSNLYIIDKMIYNLDTMIETYYNFEDLLARMIHKLNKDSEWELKKLMGKHSRRFTSENLSIFENQLKEKITTEVYKDIGLGNITNGVQSYIILKDNPRLGMRRLFQLGL